MMRCQIRIAERHGSAIRQALFGRDEVEGAAFLFAKPIRMGRGLLLTVHAVWVPPIDPHVSHVRLPAHALIEAVNRANEAGSVLIEAHSHPGSEVASFSSVDESGLEQIVPYMIDSLTAGLYGATVWGDEGLECRVYSRDGRLEVTEVRVLDGRFSCLPLARSLRNVGPSDLRFDRLERAIGRRAREVISRLRVGLVGLGGLGSNLIQALMAVGVNDFVLIDADLVKKENLDRIPYARSFHVAQRVSKVEAAREHITQRFPEARIQSLCLSLEHTQALNALKKVDVLFGAVDTYYGRLIMTNLAAAYLIPYFDCGTGVNVLEGAVHDMGGRLSVLWPGKNCLICAGRINSRLLNYEIEDEAGKRAAREGGYVKGADLPDPMVASLNGTVANLAALEFLAAVGGFKPTAEQLYFDALRGTVEEVAFSVSNECRVCHGQLGLADESGVISRFGMAKPRKASGRREERTA